MPLVELLPSANTQALDGEELKATFFLTHAFDRGKKKALKRSMTSISVRYLVTDDDLSHQLRDFIINQSSQQEESSFDSSVFPGSPDGHRGGPAIVSVANLSTIHPGDQTMNEQQNH